MAGTVWGLGMGWVVQKWKGLTECSQLNKTTVEIRGGGGEGRLSYEKVRDARRQFLFWSLGGTNKGVVQAFFDPYKAPETAAYGAGNGRFFR